MPGQLKALRLVIGRFGVAPTCRPLARPVFTLTPLASLPRLGAMEGEQNYPLFKSASMPLQVAPPRPASRVGHLQPSQAQRRRWNLGLEVRLTRRRVGLAATGKSRRCQESTGQRPACFQVVRMLPGLPDKCDRPDRNHSE